MADFEKSTQVKKWIFEETDIKKMSYNKYQKGIKIMGEIILKNQTDPQQAHKVSLKMKPEEDKEIVLFYTNKIINFFKRHNFSQSVKTHALTFFRRFYFRKTIIDYDPDFVLIASIFLALKVCQYDIHLEKMKEIFPFLQERNELNIDNIHILLDYEFFLINVLNYDMHIYSPFKALRGLCTHIELNMAEEVIELIKQRAFSLELMESEAEEIINKTFLTDLMFQFNHSFIALFSLMYVFDVELKEPLNKLFESLDIPQESYDLVLNDFDVFKNKINSINLVPENDIIEKIKKRLRFLKKNPEYVKKIESERLELLTRMKNFGDSVENNELEQQMNNLNVDLIQKKRIRDNEN